jgi:hypothetical protein
MCRGLRGGGNCALFCLYEVSLKSAGDSYVLLVGIQEGERVQ